MLASLSRTALLYLISQIYLLHYLLPLFLFNAEFAVLGNILVDVPHTKNIE